MNVTNRHVRFLDVTWRLWVVINSFVCEMWIEKNQQLTRALNTNALPIYLHLEETSIPKNNARLLAYASHKLVMEYSSIKDNTNLNNVWVLWKIQQVQIWIHKQNHRDSWK